MRSIDYGYLAVLVALWASVVWYRAQARVVGELWWSWVCIVGIITLKVGVVADPVNRWTGGVYLDQLVIHLAGIAMVTLTLSWLVRARLGTRAAYRRLRLGGAAAMTVFLVATWFASPVYDIPATSDWIPASVQVAPMMAAHWLGFHLYLFAFTVAFVALAWTPARTLPRSSVRLSIRLMVAGATLFGIKSGTEAVAQVGVVVTGVAEPDWLVSAVNPVVLVVFALFLLAVGIPLVDRSRDRAADSLWQWVRDSEPAGEQSSAR